MMKINGISLLLWVHEMDKKFIKQDNIFIGLELVNGLREILNQILIKHLCLTSITVLARYLFIKK